MKTEISAKLILASRNTKTLDTLYTFVLTIPKYLVAELNTHRVVSRNSASSRAIPSKKIRSRIINDPFTLSSYPAEKRGMAGGDELTGWRRAVCKAAWLLPRYACLAGSWVMAKVGCHKQMCNRLTEPWMWTEVVFTATDLNNFFNLRCHPAAEPHFQRLAELMEQETFAAEMVLYRNGSQRYQSLRPGELHLPFITEEDRAYHTDEQLKKISAARCCRVSYLLPETGKESDVKSDIALCDRLLEAGHMSPFEHVATAISSSIYVRNLRGFRPYRAEIEPVRAA